MNAKIENGNLLIELPLQEAMASSTGKTLIVASTHGVKRLPVRVDGRSVWAVVNAFVYPDVPVAPTKKKEAAAKTKGAQGKKIQH